MKPINMVICGWGPYRGREEIDFEALSRQGIFLITGATGAGKTTVFDALTYALYGCMSGGMREKGSVRSDFAAEDTPTFVRLIMDHGGKEYTVQRNPEYLRPKKRKSGNIDFTKEKENAVLTMPDGTILQGNPEVNKKLQEILGLDYRQFKQISMIAQGEFAKLLTANPSEKVKIFREIFETAVYDRFSSSLRERCAGLYTKVSEYRHRLEEDIHLFQPGTQEWEELTADGNYHYEAIWDYTVRMKKEYGQKQKRADKELREAEEAIILLNSRIQENESIRQQTVKLEETEKELSELEARSLRMEEIRQKLSRGEDAQKVLQTDNLWKRETEALRRMEQELCRIGEKESETRLQIRQLEDIYDNRARLKEYMELDSGKTIKQTELSKTEAERAEKEKRLGILQERYLKAEKKAKLLQRDYEEADKKYKRAVIGIAARLVKEGQPCPVCGSLEHPRIARLQEDILDEEGLERLKSVADDAVREQLVRHGEAAACKNETEALHNTVNQLSCEIQYLEEKELHYRSTYSLDSILEKLDNTGGTSNMGERLDEMTARYQRLQGLLEEQRLEQERILENLNGQREHVEQIEAQYEKALRQYGFDGRQEYESALCGQEWSEEMRSKLQEYGERKQALLHLKEHLEAGLEGKKLQDTQPLVQLLEDKREAREILAEKQKEWNIRLSQAQTAEKSIREIRNRMSVVEKEYGIIQDLSNLANGNNSKKLVFEQYVLASYFEDILQAANLRFGKMTGGRYKLFRAATVGDGRVKDNLEMLVMDYYTGKHRSVKTLSGGEAFKASLSLALGMSDVIQAESGGIRVEALFIDEGFGALDNESLEQACQTLNSLAGKDRIIGIISHVPELRERIDRQLIVDMTGQGSRLRVI